MERRLPTVDRDLVEARIRTNGQIRLQDRRDLLVWSFQQAFADGNPDQRRNDRFRGGFDIGRFRWRVAAIAMLCHHAPITSDNDGFQRPQLVPTSEAVQKSWDGACRLLSGSGNGDEQQKKEESKALDHGAMS
jgi:hypothetical protein